MRISDWSSDVCSSDLLHGLVDQPTQADAGGLGRVRPGQQGLRGDAHHDGVERQLVALGRQQGQRLVLQAALEPRARIADHARMRLDGDTRIEEIPGPQTNGRASCRAMVLKEVYILVVDGVYK